MASKIDFKIDLNSARALGSLEKIFYTWDFEAWTGLSEKLSKRIFKTDNGEEVLISVDWTPAVLKAGKMDEVYRSKPEEIVNYFSSDEYSRRTVCTASVSWRLDEPVSSASDYLRYFLYECFLIMNLSSPGSFNLYFSYIELANPVKKRDWLDDRVHLECSEYLFENALQESFDHNWPIVRNMEFSKVCDWYFSQDVGIVQVAKTRIQKTLFSLLHISKKDMGPDMLMWSAYCLEALFDTPNVMSFSFLVNRVSDLLDVPENKRRMLSQKIRKFYDYRNAFAHGNAKVIHPIGHEGWEDSVDDYRVKVQEACDFAAIIIVSSLQQYIQRNIREVEYREVSNYLELK